MFSLAIIFSLLVATANCTLNWVTVVLVDFQLRDQCAKYWDDHQSCQNPSLRVIADFGDKRIASAAWPINSQLIREQRLFFTTQWSMKIDKILVSSQIEGENFLNPFGLAPKCDQGYASMMFNEKLTLKPGQTANTRVAHIDSQCFSARFLIRVDDECPHCPKALSTPPQHRQTVGFVDTLRADLAGYDLEKINMILLAVSILSIAALLLVCQVFYRRPAAAMLPVSAASSAQSIVAVTDESAKLAKIRRIPTIISQQSRYEDVVDETVTYGYRLKSQTISKIGFDVQNYDNINDYETISITSTDSSGYSIDF